MLLTVREHAPQARCYMCGSPELVSVCHHCGKGMCQQHSPKAVDAVGKPVSGELAGLRLEGRQAGVYHCDEDNHVVKGSLRAVIVAGAAAAVVGIIVLVAVNVPAGLVLLLAGVATAVAAYLADRKRKAASADLRPPLPVLPSLDSVRVTEILRGQVRLGADGAYVSTPQPAEGMVEMELTLAKADRERLSAYREKYGLAADDPVRFSAGYAVLKGVAGLTFQPGTESASMLLPGGTAINFAGEVASHPLFRADGGRSAGQWTAQFPFRLLGTRVPGRIPVWIVPSLVPDSDKRTLEIDLHWVALGDGEQFGPEPRPLKFLRFEEIRLIVPKAWGNVESASPSNAFISNPAGQPSRTIQWQPLATAGQEKTGSQTLTIRFEKQISQADRLTGSLRAAFKGTLSGVTDVRMFRPAGGSWLQPPKATVSMEARVDFELSLNSVRYQAVRVVPDRNKDLDRSEIDNFSGVIPDYRTVIDLTNELSESGYYVKRVIENQPRGGGRANLVNRVWDIAGRRYDGVFPIDFHITLTGEEEYRGSIQANAGSTAAQLSVQGSYVNQVMENQVESEWDALHDMVGTRLKARETFGPSQDDDLPPVSPPSSPATGEWAPPPAWPQPAQEQPSPPWPRPARSAESDPDPDRATFLRNRREAATDALLAGRISEQMYRQIEAEIQAELDAMSHPD